MLCNTVLRSFLEPLNFNVGAAPDDFVMFYRTNDLRSQITRTTKYLLFIHLFVFFSLVPSRPELYSNKNFVTSKSQCNSHCITLPFQHLNMHNISSADCPPYVIWSPEWGRDPRLQR